MNLVPLYDQLLVRRDTAAEISKGGIFIPPTARNPPTQGTVVAVGVGKLYKSGKIVPGDVKVGDRVLFNEWAGQGQTIPHEGEDLMVITESEVLAVMGKK